MKGDDNVIRILNEVLYGELTAINQYFLHARMCSNWGYEKIAEILKKESIEEMVHAQNLTDRILYLEGVPNYQALGKLNIGESVEEQLKSDLALELQAIPRLKKGIEACVKASDHGTKELFEKILIDEEKHVDWIEAQLGIIKEIGIQNYLARQIA